MEHMHMNAQTADQRGRHVYKHLCIAMLEVSEVTSSNFEAFVHLEVECHAARIHLHAREQCVLHSTARSQCVLHGCHPLVLKLLEGQP